MFDFYNKVLDRFIKYVKINTQSVPNSKDTPSSKCQFDLAKILYQECLDLGLSDVYYDDVNCLVYASLDSNNKDAINVAIIAHMDTSFDVSGDGVKPWVYKNYQGGDVILNKKENIILREAEFENIKAYYGKDIVFTDGTTLLGGDDKAAIAEIMTMSEYFLANKDELHCNIKIAFTPDEEVGGLAKDLDFKRLNADIAYTVDGDHVGYYSDETFNASEAQFEIIGKNVHPGTAFGIMKNAVEIANEIINIIPNERPHNTKDRMGYYHPHYISGNVEKAILYCLIRDHDELLFEEKKKCLENIKDQMNKKYGNGTVNIVWANSYSSMKKVVDKYPFMIEELVNAIKECNIEPVHLAFRGGTDGSSISARGLACPNISAGYENGHSRYEYVPVQSMIEICKIIINLMKRLRKY